jgi:MULE transposase domain
MGKETDNVQVKTYNSSHTCANEHNIKFLTIDWLVKRYLDVFRADPRWSLPGIIHQIKSDLYMEISTQKAWNVKSKTLKILAGKEGAQYAKLQDYAAELKKSNVGSAIFYDLQYQVFRRAYICLAACKNGFLAGCRRILSFDGCYLKGRYGGQLLSAIGIDANDCIFSIAYAVVETENTNSWHWFLQLLANDLGIVNSHAWTFMSDRQKVFLI